jgi:fructokinase
MNDTCAFLVCGEALIDLVPGPGGLMRPLCGGSPYNVAIGLGRLGADVKFLGRLSRDANGSRLADRLRENKVGLDFVAIGTAPSTLAYVFPPEPGRPDVGYAFYIEGTSGALFEAEDFPAELPENIFLLHVGSFSAILGESGARIRRFAQSSGRIVSYDPNIRPTIAQDRQAIEACFAIADIVKLSDADAEFLYPGRAIDDVAATILRAGPALVAVTRGADGAMMRTAAQRIAVPGIPTEVVDTVGAGDTFMAALLWQLGLRGLIDRAALRGAAAAELEAVAHSACRAASIVVGRPGADPPFAAEL